MSKNNSNQLVVEGYDDLYSVVGLMKGYVPWPNDVANAPVYIHIGNGAEEILRTGYLSVILKGSALKTLGVMLDADAKPKARYDRVRSLCEEFFPNLPSDLPADGLVIDNIKSQKRLGVWIMPDNCSEGSLETFLRHLVPDQSEPVWTHAVESTQTAKGMGCPCHDGHVGKAHLYTWLAWQNPPGQSPGESIVKKVLDPHSTYAATFVSWFRTLYRL